MNRFAAVQASPMLRILASIAPSTALSRSASPKTRNGALPPSSMDTLSTFWADCSMSFWPTPVEPVKVSFRSRGSAMIGAETLPDWRRGDDVDHAVGQAGLDQHGGQSQCGQRGLRGGLDHDGAAGGQRGADLAGAHGEREVPRGDRVDRADGLLHGQQPGAAGGGDGVAAGDPDGLLGEPAEELGAVGDLAAGLGQRLAHFQGHQQGDVLGAFGEQFEGLAQDLAAGPRVGRGPVARRRRPRRRAPRCPAPGRRRRPRR